MTTPRVQRHRPPMPAYRVDEIAARLDYARLTWRERLVTPPPPGWAGAWTARLVSRLVPQGREHREKETSEP